MAEQEQITVEDMSPTPVEPVAPTTEQVPEEQPTEAPAAQPATPEVAPAQAPAITEDDLVLPEDAPRPADPDEVLAQAPQRSMVERGVAAARETVGPVIEGAVSAIEQGTEALAESTGFPTTRSVLFPEPTGPVILPKPFIERVRDGDFNTPQDLANARNEMGDIYWNGVLSTGDEARDNKRKEVIGQAVGYAIPRIGPDGRPVLAPEGSETKYVYDAVIPFSQGITDINTRIVTLMEAAPNDSGVYHLITPDGGWQRPKVLDTGRTEMRREFQDPISSFFFRVESEEGGLENYRKILEQGGITDPVRQTYYMRQQATSNNPLMGIESTRLGVGIQDMVGLLANVGMGTPDVVSDFTAALPFYWYENIGGLTNLFTPNKMPYSKVTEVAAQEIDKITKGNIDHLYFDSAIDKFAKSAGVSPEEADVVLSYSPDLFTIGGRFAVESVATGAPILGVSRALAAKEATKFADWALEKAGEITRDSGWATGIGKELGLKEAGNVDDAFRILEAKGINANEALKQYSLEMGGTKLGRAYIADALDLDVQARSMLPGPFRSGFLKPKIDSTARDLTDVEAKIDAARTAGRSRKYISQLEARKQLLQKDLLQLREQTIIPPTYLNYIKDEALATTFAATAYQAFYDLGGEDPVISAFGSVSAAFLISLPKVRGSLSAKVEDISVWFDTIGDPEAYKVNSAAVKMRRHVENAPPEIRNQIMAFAEYRANAMEELTKFTFREGHPRAGEQIISDEAFDQGFWRMSGLLSFRALKNSQLSDTINIQSDAGKLSEGLAEIELRLQQEQKLMDESSQLFDNFRYLMFDEDFDPNSDVGKLVTTMVGFYDQNLARITQESSVIEKIVDQRKTLINNFLSGNLEEDVMEGILVGDNSLTELLRIDRMHYMKLGLEPDASVERRLQLLDEYYVDLNSRVAEAMAAHTRQRFFGNDELANNTFRFWAQSSESRAYQEASVKFDALRENPEFAGARVDLTDVFDALLTQGDEGIELDERALMEFTGIGEQGTYNSRELAKLNIPGSTQKLVGRVFEEAAGEYLEAVSGQLPPEMIERLLEAEGNAGGTNIDRFLALRKYIEENRETLGEELYERVKPRLGVDTSAFMHVVSGIGKRSGDSLAGQQFRQALLDRGRTGFYDDFYNPMASKDPIEGFGEAYDEAREFYRSRYIQPFRDMNRTVARDLRSPDEAVRARAFEQFMDEGGINQPVRSVEELNTNVLSVIREMNGGRPLDVTTEEGAAIRTMFTKYVMDEISRTPGGRQFKQMLIRSGKSPMVTPSQAEALEALMQEGVAAGVTIRLENLTARTLDENGELVYLFRDDFGNPIVDPKLIDSISFEAGLLHDPTFRVAAKSVEKDIADEGKVILEALEKVNTPVRSRIEAGKYFVEKFDEYSGGYGEAFYTLAQKADGLTEIARLKSDFVASQVAKGVDADVAAEGFEQMKVQSVTDYIFSTISRPGDNRAFREIGPDGKERSVVKRTTEIDPKKLFDLLGVRGDTVSASRQEKVIRDLLGDEVFDHMKMLGNELFVVDSATGQLNVRGISMPLSAESLLSRGTSFFRGVISLRWLVTEAAVRASRQSNFELTKMMLFNPKVGREILDMVTEGNYDVSREPAFVRVLLGQIARNDAVQQYVLQEEGRAQTQTMMLEGAQQLVAPQPMGTPEEQEEQDALEQQMTELVPLRMGR